MGKKNNKILWVKFGWSDYYRGGPVDGNFGYLTDQMGGENEGRGHEAYNFAPGPDGRYYCYVPPQAGSHAPYNASSEDWTVICLAKKPKQRGIHIVGWYEHATLLGEWNTDHQAAVEAGEDDNWSYCITSKYAFLVPPEYRTKPFSHPSVRQAKFSFLAGPHVQSTENKQAVLRLLEERLVELRIAAKEHPSQSNAPDPELDSADPLIGFGTPEHRKKVEEAAERAVVAHYEAQGFAAKRVAHLPCGYDYEFSKRRTVHCVEVKGTSLPQERFYLTRNENKARDDARWRLAMVTDALKAPRVTIFNNLEFTAAFDLEPYVLIGTRIIEPGNS